MPASGAASKLIVDSLPYSRQAENTMRLRLVSPEESASTSSARWGSSASRFADTCAQE